MYKVQPWVKYELFVVARNAIGTSDKASKDGRGNAAVCVTPQTAPKRNPQNVCTRLGRPNQLVIVWEVSHGVDSQPLLFHILCCPHV